MRNNNNNKKKPFFLIIKMIYSEIFTIYSTQLNADAYIQYAAGYFHLHFIINKLSFFSYFGFFFN